jgi:hypothetical protein
VVYCKICRLLISLCKDVCLKIEVFWNGVPHRLEIVDDRCVTKVGRELLSCSPLPFPPNRNLQNTDFIDVIILNMIYPSAKIGWWLVDYSLKIVRMS